MQAGTRSLCRSMLKKLRSGLEAVGKQLARAERDVRTLRAEQLRIERAVAALKVLQGSPADPEKDGNKGRPA